MSSAFVREGESQQLKEVAPNLSALLYYLRRENGGTVISNTRVWYSAKYQQDVYEMSDGLTYALDGACWRIILD
jgi:hypothetical protein